MLRVAPGRGGIDADADLGGLAIPGMPGRPQGRDQTLVHGHAARLDDAGSDGGLPLQADGFAVQPVCPAVTAEVGGPRREMSVAQPSRDVRTALLHKAILRRLRLFLVEHGEHNQASHHPVRDQWFVARSGSRRRAFGLLQQGDGQAHQLRYERGRRSPFTHPRDLRWFLFPCGKESITIGVPFVYINRIPRHPHAERGNGPADAPRRGLTHGLTPPNGAGPRRRAAEDPFPRRAWERGGAGQPRAAGNHDP